MQSAEGLSKQVGKRKVCAVLGVPRGRLYGREKRRSPKNPSPRALRSNEKETVCQELDSKRFQDCAPREVYTTLLDEGRYLCSCKKSLSIFG
jgi:putative transposase